MKIFLKKTACAFLAALLLALPALLGGCGLFSDGNVYARVEEGLISADGFIYDLFENGDAEIVGINRNDIFPDTSTDGNGTTECHLVIPDTVDSHPVTSIGSDAFRGNTALMYLTLGDNVREIKRSAFEECEALICVDGGKKLARIEDSAFSYCVSLCRFADMPALKTIEAAAFFGCTALPSLPSMPATVPPKAVLWQSSVAALWSATTDVAAGLASSISVSTDVSTLILAVS